MPLTIPPELKKITPFVRRAEELDKDQANPESRLVAFYCRQYAVHSGIPLAQSPEAKGCLGEMLGTLEVEKKAMDSFTRDEAKFLCRKFADKVFDKADLEDRTGEADKNTARTFYAAASFLEMLQQFYKDDDDSEEHQEEKKRVKYCKWKATEILKALKEGRKPTPGGYGEDADLEDDDDDEKKEATEPIPPPSTEHPIVETVADDDEEVVESTGDATHPKSVDHEIRLPDPESDSEPEQAADDSDMGPPPAYPGPGDTSVAPPPIPPPQPKVAPPPKLSFAPAPAPAPPVPPVTHAAPPLVNTAPRGVGALFSSGNKKKLSKSELSDANELTRFGLAALEEKDPELAAERLQQALQILRR